MTTAPFAAFVNTYQPDATTIANLCIELVRSWSGDKGPDDIYSELISNARDTGAVDTMLYQLEGDPEYAENVALLILSSASNYPELAAAINQLIADPAGSAGSNLDRRLALADLYGMYLLARHGAEAREVAYRDASGRIKTHIVEREFPAARLFEAVRDQYAAMM